MKYKNLYLLGTSHIAKQSLDDVEEAVSKKKPDIIALELDKKRLPALLEKERQKPKISDIMKIGIKGFIFNIIGAWAEKRLGKETGISPGSEMKKAFELARQKNLKVSLIDQDISITLKKISQSLTWKEKWNFLVDIFKAVILRKREVVFDLRKVPSENIIKKLTGKVKKRYPNLYRVLVEERNEIMAKRLAHLMMQNPEEKILAVIGAGHEKEMLEIIKKEYKDPEISYSFTVS